MKQFWKQIKKGGMAIRSNTSALQLASKNMPACSRALGLRKGAWSVEEDLLLKKCIQKYGEGNWHKVPLRAGLNRCRKSCRLRWLNYLNPNIKRGEFASDEVDLIIRMHKLLGNRWSLISGRLPGRTANDVKNYWNTHLNKKLLSRPKDALKAHHRSELEITKKTEVIRPQPRTFSRNSEWLLRRPKASVQEITTVVSSGAMEGKSSPPNHQFEPNHNESTAWWDNILIDEEEGTNICCSIFGSGDDELIVHEDMKLESTSHVVNNGIVSTTQGDDTHLDDDLYLMENLWGLLGSV